MAKAKIYLYKEGNECTSLTGGIVGKYNTSGTFTLGTFTKQDKYISCVNNSTTKQVYVTSANKIDLTNYCNFICDFDVVNVRNTSSDVYKPTLTVRSNFTGNSDLLTRGKLIAGLRQILTLDVTDINYSSNVCFQTHANDYNIYKMYLETKENVLTINSQENDVITFSAKDLGLVTINKIDVLVNGVVSKTYTDNYSNLSYTVDKSLCYIGNNNIEIRVTYSQGDDITETVSEYLTYKYTIPPLPLETPLLDTVERVKLLTKSKQSEKTMLSSILTSKNVEVLEEDKMSDLIGKVDLLEPMKPLIYGIDIDETNSNPSTCVTYTDDAIGFSPLFCGNGTLDYGSWENTFIIQGNKPCVLKDGVVQYYLNPSDYSLKENGEVSDITSGNDGDVMAEFKKCYYKLWKEGNTVKFRVSPVKVDNSWCCNAFLSEDGNATEKDYMYISTYESYSLTSKMRSLSGKAPWVSHTIGTARTQAAANGSGYQQLTLSKYTFVAMLNTLVTKSLDHQAKIGQGRSKSSNTSAINTGTMNTKGQFWGDQTATNGMKAFHIENFYGNVWTFMDGLVVSSRVSKYKVSGSYNDSGTGYTNGYSVPTADGYINKINCSNDNGIIPSSSTGSATTYYSDYMWQNSGTYISMVGGRWNDGSYVGSFYLYVNNASSSSSSALGSRLSFS